MNECKNGKCKFTRQGLPHSHTILKANRDFNEMSISLFSQRISDELSNISAYETKASIVIASSLAVLGILFTNQNFSSMSIISEFYTKLIKAGIVVPFVLSFFFGLYIVMPRERLSLVIPRNFNNNYGLKKKSKYLEDLKHSLIKNVEFMEDSRITETVCLKISYVLQSIGFVMLVMVLLR